MDMYSRNKIEAVKELINEIYYVQEFDVAKKYQERLNVIETRLEQLTDDFEDYLEKTNLWQKLKEMDIEISIFLDKEETGLKRKSLIKRYYEKKVEDFVKSSGSKTSQELYDDLKSMVLDIKKEAIDEELASKIDEISAMALLHIYIQQLKNGEPIDLKLADELSTREKLTGEIKNKLLKMSEEKDEIISYDILRMCKNITPDTLQNQEMWKMLAGTETIQLKEETNKTPKQNLEKEKTEVLPVKKKKSILEKVREKFGKKTKYVFEKINEKTGEKKSWAEYHAFPPKGRLLRKCQSQCVALEINGKSVAEVDAMDHMESLQSITFGEGITEIRRRNKSELPPFNQVSEITVSDDVQVIGDNTFNDYAQLAKINFGNNIREIEKGAFCNCGALKTIHLPASLRNLGEWVFAYCESLENLELPEDLMHLQAHTFCKCSHLKNIKFGKSMQRIEEGVFAKCKSLKTVTLPEELISLGKYVFTGCDALKSVEFGSQLKEIGDDCFRGDYHLVIKKLPASLTKVGKNVEKYANRRTGSIIPIQLSFEEDLDRAE